MSPTPHSVKDTEDLRITVRNGPGQPPRKSNSSQRNTVNLLNVDTCWSQASLVSHSELFEVVKDVWCCIRGKAIIFAAVQSVSEAELTAMFLGCGRESLRATEVTARSCSQVMFIFIVQEHHLWLDLVEMCECDKVRFFNGPIPAPVCFMIIQLLWVGSLPKAIL